MSLRDDDILLSCYIMFYGEGDYGEGVPLDIALLLIQDFVQKDRFALTYRFLYLTSSSIYQDYREVYGRLGLHYKAGNGTPSSERWNHSAVSSPQVEATRSYRKLRESTESIGIVWRIISYSFVAWVWL